MTAAITINAFYVYLTAKTDLMAALSNNLYKYNLEKTDLAGSGESALVINLTGGDAPRPNHTTNPRLNCTIYSDHTRNASKEITAMDRYDRMYNVWRILDPLLHWVDHEPQVLDGMRITGCLRGIEPTLNDDKDAGLPYLWAAYDINRVF